jgi:hypothetical protein
MVSRVVDEDNGRCLVYIEGFAPRAATLATSCLTLPLPLSITDREHREPRCRVQRTWSAYHTGMLYLPLGRLLIRV